jgi:hypothetical protein
MSIGEDHSWIKEKKSWIITTNSNERGSFEPLDPPKGSWSLEEMEEVLGTADLVLLNLEGKWTGEVLICAAKKLGEKHYRNELAAYLVRQSLKEQHVLYGPVLMTLRELLDEEPPEKRMTLIELVKWVEPRA